MNESNELKEDPLAKVKKDPFAKFISLTGDEREVMLALKFNKKAISKLSSDLAFEGEVVEQRCPHLLPYDSFPRKDVFRHRRIAPPVKRKPRLQPRKDDVARAEEQKVTEDEPPLLGVSQSFERLKPPRYTPQQQELAVQRPVQRPVSPSPSDTDEHTWEEYCISMLSKGTAQLIVSEFTPHRHTQEKLNAFLHRGDQTEEETVVVEEPVKPTEKPHKKVERIIHKRADERYTEHQQNVYPTSPSKWTDQPSVQGRVEKGLRKWVEYPQPVEDDFKLKKICVSDASVSEKSSHEHITDDSNNLSDGVLQPIVNEWRAKWFLDRRDSYDSFSDLVRDMTSINDHVRLQAVTSCSKIVNNHRQQQDIGVVVGDEKVVLETLEKLLEDVCPQVTLAAALSLFNLSTPTKQATDLLLDWVQLGGPLEQWSAVQCLAAYHHHKDCVVRVCVDRLRAGGKEAAVAANLLQNLSASSDNVMYMVAELLNSPEIDERTSACNVLATLHTKLTKDIISKIFHLVWNDGNKKVQIAATKALGATNNAKRIHNALKDQLNSSDDTKKADALSKLRHLGLMTSSLKLSLFVCLKSHNERVCNEAIKTISSIGINDKDVILAIRSLVSPLRTNKIKISAINALAKLKDNSLETRDSLLWSIRYDNNEQVRVCACVAITRLRFHDDEIVNILQNLIDTEEEGLLKSKVAMALYCMGVEPHNENQMFAGMRQQVNNMCDKITILQKMGHIKPDDRQQENTKSKTKQTHFRPMLETEKVRVKTTNPLNSLCIIDPPFIPYNGDSFHTLQNT